MADGKTNTIDPESRMRNNVNRGTDLHTGDILFDQLLLSDQMHDRYVAESVKVFDAAVAVQGNNNTRASDHLPVFALFTFGGDPPDADDPAGVGVSIAALFPNPPGTDAGNEEVHLRNANTELAEIDGWMLEDKAGNQFELTGSIAGDDTRVITLPANTLPLTNTGDVITLTNASGDQVDEVEYTKAQAKTESVIAFQD